MIVRPAMPAYNEAPRLPSLLNRWVNVFEDLKLEHRYVIVDDGSTDETPETLRSFAERHPADVVTHNPNQGFGRSLRDALHQAVGQSGDDDLIVTMDADDTQPPELLGPMIAKLRETGADVVIASRYQVGATVSGVSALRRSTSYGARVLFRLLFPIPGVRDYTCNFRLYRAAIIRRAFDTYGGRFCDRPGFDAAANVLLRLAKLNARFAEVPLTLRYDAKAAASTMPVAGTVGRTLSLLLARRLGR